MMPDPFEKFTKKETTPPASKPAPQTPDFEKFRRRREHVNRPEEASDDPFTKFKASKSVEKPVVPAAKQPTPAPQSKPSEQAPQAIATSFDDLLSFDTPTSHSTDTVTPTLEPFVPFTSPLSDFPRVDDHETLIFAEGVPAVVALTRLQSGVGYLEAKLEASEGLTLGVVGETMEGKIFGSSSPSPLQGLVTVTPAGLMYVHLREVKTLRRLLFFVTAKSPETKWEGAVTIKFRHATLTVPLERESSCENLALATLFNVDGEVVVRAENAFHDTPLRGLFDSFGYNHLAWKNDRSPLFV